MCQTRVRKKTAQYLLAAIWNLIKVQICKVERCAADTLPSEHSFSFESCQELE